MIDYSNTTDLCMTGGNEHGINLVICIFFTSLKLLKRISLNSDSEITHPLSREEESEVDYLTLKLKDNLPHNTYQIYVKPHVKNTQMTLEYQIFDEKALE